jgi:hypothetical protein
MSIDIAASALPSLPLELPAHLCASPLVLFPFCVIAKIKPQIKNYFFHYCKFLKLRQFI